jgi:predicted TIM-barrel fold metal-dependent hydrolase
MFLRNLLGVIPSFFAAIVLSYTVGGDEERPRFEEIRKIDIHAHVFEEMPALVEMLRRNNASIINVCNRGRDGSVETMHRVAREMHRNHPDLFPFASCFDLTRIEETGYSNEVIKWLKHTFEGGAVMTKIWKEVGMELRRKDESYVLPDDPIFDPIYEFLADQSKPLLAHLADPIDGWLPLDPASPHYRYFKNNPEFHLYGKFRYPTHAQIIAARDHILEKHARLVVIGAHLGSLEHDLEALAQRLDRYPNFNVDCAARTRDLTRLDREKVRKLFLRHQDRILYGVDMTWKPFREKLSPTDAKRASFVKSLENRYRSDYAFYSSPGTVQYDDRSIPGLDLPRPVLEKFFHGNAERLILGKSPKGNK